AAPSPSSRRSTPRCRKSSWRASRGGSRPCGGGKEGWGVGGDAPPVDGARGGARGVGAGGAAEEREGTARRGSGGAAAPGGATAASFPPIVAVGVRSALPHARPTHTARIADAEFVLFDWGASGDPYKSDLTRVCVTGKVTSKFEAIYRTVLAAQERAIVAIRP